MKKSIKYSTAFILSLFLSISVSAQKKVKHFKVEKSIPLSATEVWKVVGEDYGSVYNSHPKIINSEYVGETIEGGEGAERMCYFNVKGTQYLHERVIDFSPEVMSFTNVILKAGKFPVDPEHTIATFQVVELDENTCRISMDMTFRTKPAFMGGMMMGSFTRLMSDYFIAIEHHIKTGEKVTKENFKEIKEDYQEEALVTKY